MAEFRRPKTKIPPASQLLAVGSKNADLEFAR